MPMTRDELRELVHKDPTELPIGKLFQIHRAFGPWARWVLAPEALERIDESFGQSRQPDVAETTGEGRTAILFVLLSQVPLLRSAFALPVAWQQEPVAASRVLPLGDEVSRSLEVSGWRLTAPEGVSPAVVKLMTDPNLVSWNSGWVPAAIALLDVADSLMEPPPRSLATGRWSDDSGILPVSGIEKKVRVAAELGAKVLFIPELDYEQAEQAVPPEHPDLKIVPLKCRSRDFRAVLLSCEEFVPPAPSADSSEDEHRRYIERLIELGQLKRAQAHYEQLVMPRVARILRKAWLEETQQQSVHTLVTIASDSTATAFYSIVATQPQRVLLLHTPDMAENAAKIRAHVERFANELFERVPEWQVLSFGSPDELLESLKGLREGWLRNLDPGDVVADLTPGTKEMSIQMYISVPQRGDRAVYVRHQPGKGMAIPFTEKLVVWPSS